MHMLDMTKAYYRVDWSYLENVIVNLGFHQKWVQLVMACVTTVCSAVCFKWCHAGHLPTNTTATLIR